MRNLIFLLDELIKLIPCDNDHEIFKNNMIKVRDQASFTAPEQIIKKWNEAQYEISRFFEGMDKLPEWAVRFVNLWTNRQDK